MIRYLLRPNVLWTIWGLWAQFCGVFVLAVIGALLIILPQKTGTVWVASNVTIRTPVVKQDGRLIVSFDVKALQSCPGTVVTTMSSKTGNPPATIDYRRPIIHPGIDKKGLLQEVDMSEAVFPGKWDVVITANSRCPTHIQEDVLVPRFEVEVVP